MYTSSLPRSHTFPLLLLIAVLWLAVPALAVVSPDSITRITNDGKSRLAFGRQPQIMAPDGSFVFIKVFKEGSQFWLRHADGQAESISRIGWLGQCSVSPDGSMIAFSFATNSAENAEGIICLYDVAKKTTRTIASGFTRVQFSSSCGYSFIAWSPDSTSFLMLFSREGQPERAESYLIEAASGKMTGLTPNNWSTGTMLPGCWSPDSTKIVMVSMSTSESNTRLWVCNRDGSGLHPITTEDASIVNEPVWSPKGDWIAYVTTQDRLKDEKGQNLGDIWMVRPDGSDAHPITHGTNPSMRERFGFYLPYWTPDAKNLLAVWGRYTESGQAYGTLSLVDATTGQITPILVNDPETDLRYSSYENNSVLSPDGKKIAITTELYTVHGQKTDNPTYTEERDLLYVYDIATKTMEEIVKVVPASDGYAAYWRPHWSAGSDKILFAKAKMISITDWTYEPDLYMYQLPAAAEPSTKVEVTVTAPTVETPVAFTAGESVLIEPQYRRAADIAAALPQAYSGMYRVDPGLNALVVSAPDEARFTALQRDIAMLDRLPAQLMVDVLVTELTKDASRQLGLDWEFARGRFGANLPLSPVGDAGQVIFQGVGKLDETFFATLSALEEQGKATIHANPRVAATNGTQATINIRRTDNFLFESGTDNQGRPVRQRSDISADIILKIQPQLLKSNKIATNLEATVESFVFGAKGDLPDTTRRQAVTDVTVGDGETIIIGGLTLQEDTRKVQKTPLLSDIPLIGNLFKKENTSTKQTTLVIFVSPRRVTATATLPAAPAK